MVLTASAMCWCLRSAMPFFSGVRARKTMTNIEKREKIEKGNIVIFATAIALKLLNRSRKLSANECDENFKMKEDF